MPSDSEQDLLPKESGSIAANNRNGGSSTVWLAWSFALALWCCHPTISANYFTITMLLNWYPVKSDSIAIPMLGNFILGVLGFPFWIWFCHRAFKNLPKRGRLFLPNSELWRHAPIRTFALGLLFIAALLVAVDDFQFCKELAASDYSKYAYFGVCSVGSSLGWALFWLLAMNCVERPCPPLTEPVDCGDSSPP